MHVLNLYMLGFIDDSKWYDNFDTIASGKIEEVFSKITHSDSLILKEVFNIDRIPTEGKTQKDIDFELHLKYVKRSHEENTNAYDYITHFKLDWHDDLQKAKKMLNNSDVHKLRYVDAFLGNGELKSTESSKNLDLDEFPIFYNMIDTLKLQSYKARFMIQKPGHIVPTHIDNLNHNETAMRFGIALNDWEYGQFWHFGTSVWTNWKAGDCITWNKLSPHGTANVGHYDRYTLQITGVPSKNTISKFFPEYSS